MDLSQRLAAVAVQQSEEGEFPSWLLEEVLALADDAALIEDNIVVVETLIEQIGDFDPYAGAGCFDTSVNVESIRKTIRRITG